MITKPDIVDLLKKSENRYELVNIIAKRARQINAGQDPMVETDEQAEVTIASEEFNEGKFGRLTEEGNETQENTKESDTDNKEIEPNQ